MKNNCVTLLIVATRCWCSQNIQISRCKGAGTSEQDIAKRLSQKPESKPGTLLQPKNFTICNSSDDVAIYAEVKDK